MSVTPLLVLIATHLGGNHPVLDGEAPAGPSLPPSVKPADPPKMTDAERVARLQQTLDADRAEIEKLKQQLEDPASDYTVSQRAFQKLEMQLEAQKKELEQAKQKGEAKQLAEIEKSLPDLQKQWQLAKDRFNLAFEERKTLQQKIGALTEKLDQNQKRLEQLSGKQVEPGKETPKDAGKTVEPEEKGSPPKEVKQATPPVETPENKELNPPNPVPSILTDLAKKKDKGESKELVTAKHDAQSKEVEAEKAKEKVESISQRVDTLRKNVELEQKLLGTLHRKAENVKKTMTVLDDEYRQLLAKGANVAQLSELWKKINDERQRLEAVHVEINDTKDRLAKLQKELAALEAEENAAQLLADEKQQEADAARKKVAELQNPYTLRNVLQWLIDRGPVILIILLCMFLLNRLMRLLSKRLIHVQVRSSRKNRKDREVEQRSETLAGVLRNFASIVIFLGGTLMLLTAIDVPVAPLMGSAAVFGLAIAFGAQNLIRDYFTGFMILAEDQYGVKDVVRIGETAGQVERISLRMTVLRDLEGVLHFIPHGTITKVANLTHSWSRALFNVGVAYKENVDNVIAVLRELGKEMRNDAEFGPLITEDMEMLGVDDFGDSAVTIKFFMKTKPTKQWPVKREMLRRIKNRFDQLGIEIPFPHRTVYHRSAEESHDQPASRAA